MKNLSNYFQMTSSVNENMIKKPNVPQDCNLVVVNDGKGGLTHFYLLKGKKYVRIASEMCKKFSVECDGGILQLDFSQYSALYYVDDRNKLVSLGCSFKNVECFVHANIAHIIALEGITAKEKCCLLLK